MIPKRAAFYWSGPPMSWLRQQSIDTFKRWNPDWEVTVLDGSNIPTLATGLRGEVLKSDWARYRWLVDRGGFYFDTDFIFTAPIPDIWRAREVALAMKDGTAHGIAVLGGVPGSRFWSRVESACQFRANTGIAFDYQALGVKLLWTLQGVKTDLREVITGLGERFFEIPLHQVQPVGWAHVEFLWSNTNFPPPADLVGLHWYGGDRLSEEYERQIGPESHKTHPCLVTRTLEAVGACHV